MKSDAELDCLRYSNAVGSAWMKTMMEAVEPGRTEADLVSIGLPVLVAGGGFPADIVAGSGNPCKPQAPRGIPSYNATRPLERGDLLRLDTVGTVRGYDCDMARSTCVGAEPTEAQLTVLEQAIEFVETLVDAVAPGVTHEAVHDVGTAWMVDHGYPPHAYFEGFWPVFGHHLGLSVEGPMIGAGQTAEIAAGHGAGAGDRDGYAGDRRHRPRGDHRRPPRPQRGAHHRLPPALVVTRLALFLIPLSGR